MRTGGDRPRIVGRWLLLVAVLTTWPADHWGSRTRLAEARLAQARGHPKEALAIAEQLLDTDVATDAAYLAGYIRGYRGELRSARRLLQQALSGFQRAGRHAEASRAADILARVAHSEGSFDDELDMSQLAVDEATISGDTHILRLATLKLAEFYDRVGMTRKAGDNFFMAAEHAASWPADLTIVYFKQAESLIDLGTPRDLQTALDYLDKAAAKRQEAIALGLGDRVAAFGFSIRLNRADALLQQGRLDTADRELALAEQELGPDLDEKADEKALTKLRLVKGYVAARRHDLGTATALFTQASHGVLEGDYRWRMAVELARLHRDAGHPGEAERAYRTAIAITEELRGEAAAVELRPWILSRRTLPYSELLALLVDQGRGVDALAVAESLHARTWLDVVLAQGIGDTTTSAQALTIARLRQRLSAVPAPALDGSRLMELIGDRDVLVFLAVNSATWRVQVARGQVEFQRLTDDDVSAVDAFLEHPGDRVAAERAASALLPAELTASVEPLYVIADGHLADVPFAALRPHGRYLIEDRPVARLPGLAALRCVWSTWDDRVVLIGDSRGNLPDAAREVQHLATSFGSVALLGPAATRAALAPGYGARLLHLAVHGIQTSVGRAIELADGNLTAAEVVETGLHPEVVVLTGCATAVSSDAESWSGFPSAFLAAGSRYVVATLRSVGDAAAARVTEAYYAQPASLNPIARLAAAQGAVASELPVEVWASFTAWGSATCGDHLARE